MAGSPRARRKSCANILVFAILSLSVLSLAGCSVFGTQAAATPSIQLKVFPATASVKPGQTQQFTVSVSGISNASVTWSTTGGSVSPGGIYTAPTQAGSYVVTATSTVDTTVSASAAVTVSAAVSISISPASASIYVDGTQQFAASVAGSSNTAVTWSASGGSVSSSGLYTAPNTAGTFTVTATSVADNTTSVSATVTVNAAPVVTVTLSPTSASLLTNGTQQFTASVSGSSNTAVTWSASGGSISSSGLYTAPSAAGNYTVKATSSADSTKSASATVTVSAPVQHTVTLSWTASSSSVSGYDVYRGTVSGGPYTQINTALEAATNYVDNTVESGTTYFYVVTAVNSSAIQSAYSNQVTAVVPTP